MFNEKLLRIRMLDIGMKMPELADVLGIALSSLYNKINGSTEFTRSEIQKISEIFGWEWTMKIFFFTEE